MNQIFGIKAKVVVVVLFFECNDDALRKVIISLLNKTEMMSKNNVALHYVLVNGNTLHRPCETTQIIIAPQEKSNA